jgi:hypothetical protein
MDSGNNKIEVNFSIPSAETLCFSSTTNHVEQMETLVNMQK